MTSGGQPVRELREQQAVQLVVTDPGHVVDGEEACVVDDATGEFVQTWSYPDLGVEIDFSRADEKKAFTVYRVTATEPCDFRGYMGLNIGAFQVEVEALAKQLEKEPGIQVSRSEGGYGFLWTESYQMLSVGITDGKVSQLYIGPGPE